MEAKSSLSLELKRVDIVANGNLNVVAGIAGIDRYFVVV